MTAVTGEAHVALEAAAETRAKVGAKGEAHAHLFKTDGDAFVKPELPRRPKMAIPKGKRR